MPRSSINGSPATPPQQVVTVSNPAAGSNWSYTVPVGSVWALEAVNYAISTSGTVSNRLPRVRVVRGANTIYVAVGAAVTAASSSATNFWAKGSVSSTTTTTSQTMPIMDCPTLIAGDVIDSHCLNLAAGDTLTSITLVFSNVQ